MRRVITPHILVVDDDPLLLTSLRDILESNGHSIVTADGGWKGIDEYFAVRQRGQTFDVVISGLGMPKIDGRAVAVAIRSAEPATPIILLTGWGHRLQGEHDLIQHVDRVLSKPPRISELRAALGVFTS